MSYYQFPTQSSSPYSSFPMSISGIQGRVLEVTVVGCNKLKDTEWISRQDPYVCLEYANSKHRTRTHTDGGKNPTFQEKFVIPLIEGLREINVKVWNSNSITFDYFIGEGKVQLQKVLSQGYDDGTWPIQTKSGGYGGEVRLIMHYSAPNISAKPNKPAAGGYAPSAPPAHMYSTPPLASAYAPPPAAYPAPSPYPSYSAAPAYRPNPVAYRPSPAPGGYPPSPYGAPPPAAYPPAPYPPSTTYPPPPSTYPPPPQASSFYPPPQGPYGIYPPPY